MKWKDCSSDDNSWEPEENLTFDLIRKFEAAEKAKKAKNAKKASGKDSAEKTGFDLGGEPEKILGMSLKHSNEILQRHNHAQKHD